MSSNYPISRRKFVLGTGAAMVAAAFGASGLVACSSSAASSSASAASAETSASASAEASATAADTSTVIIAIPQDAEPEAGFDPTKGWGSTGHAHNPLIQSTLMFIKDDITLGYDLATNYEISDDGLTWTFTIRDDAKFTSGAPVKASDVAFTYTRAMDEVSELDLSMLDKVEATDDTTLVFTLNKKYTPFAYVVANVGIVPEEGYDEKYSANPIGSGPYKLVQWDKGEQIIFEANPDYYGTVPSIERLVCVLMSEEAAFAAAQAGQVDVAYTSAAFSQSTIDGYELRAFESVDHREMNLPVIPAGQKVLAIDGKTEVDGGNDVTCNLAIRQAISYATDRQAIADKVFNGYATPAYSNSPGMPWENPEVYVDYDVDKAHEIMKADGWTLNADNVYEKDGLLAEFTVTCMDDPSRQGVLAAVKEMMDEFGIKIDIKGGMSWDEIDPTTYSTPNAIGGGVHSPIADIGRFYTGKNRACYSNEAVDKHMDDGLAAKNMEECYEHFKLAAWDGKNGYATKGDCPFVFFVTLNHLFFVKNGLNVKEDQVFPHGYGWAVCNFANEWSWA